MTKNSHQEDKKSIEKENSLLALKPDKKSWWRRVVRMSKLFGEVGEYVFDEQTHADKIKKDILRIERERAEEHRRLDMKRRQRDQKTGISAVKKKEGVFSRWLSRQRLAKNTPQPTAAEKLRGLYDGESALNMLKNDKPSLSFESAPELNWSPTKNIPPKVVPTPEIKIEKAATVTVPKTPLLEIDKLPSESIAPKVVEPPVKPLDEAPAIKPRIMPKGPSLMERLKAWFEGLSKKPTKIEKAKAKPNFLTAAASADVKLKDDFQAPETAAPKAPKIISSKPEKSFWTPKPKMESVEIKEPLPPTKSVAAPVFADKKKRSVWDHKSRLAKHLADELAHETKLSTKNEVENRYWQSFNIIRANLIKEQKSLFYNWRRRMLSLAFFVSLSVLIVLLAYGGLLMYQEKKATDNSGTLENLASINKQINAEQNKMEEINKFNNRLIYVGGLLDNHVYWTKFFKLLESRTIPNVYYQSFMGDLTGVYKIPAVAKDFSSITTQTQVMLDYDNLVSLADPQNAKSILPPPGADGSPVAPLPGPDVPLTADSFLKPGNVTFDLNLTLNPSAIFTKTEVKEVVKE